MSGSATWRALRWVLPTADGSRISSDVPADLVERVARSLLVPASGAPAVGTVAS